MGRVTTAAAVALALTTAAACAGDPDEAGNDGSEEAVTTGLTDDTVRIGPATTRPAAPASTPAQERT